MAIKGAAGVDFSGTGFVLHIFAPKINAPTMRIVGMLTFMASSCFGMVL